MGAPVYWPLRVLCLCVCMGVCLCVISNQSMSKKTQCQTSVHSTHCCKKNKRTKKQQGPSNTKVPRLDVCIFIISLHIITYQIWRDDPFRQRNKKAKNEVGVKAGSDGKKVPSANYVCYENWFNHILQSSQSSSYVLIFKSVTEENQQVDNEILVEKTKKEGSDISKKKQITRNDSRKSQIKLVFWRILYIKRKIYNISLTELGAGLSKFSENYVPCILEKF